MGTCDFKSSLGVAWSLDLTLFYLVMQKKIRPCRRKVFPSGGSIALSDVALSNK